jgi:hypothetical protein
MAHLVCLALSASIIIGCKTPKKVVAQDDDESEALGPGGCGTERWSIKTGTDSQAGQIPVGSPQATSIGTLGALAAPHTLPSQRISPTELTAFTLKNVTVKEIKLESDSDYHLVLTDATGATMVAEIPSPNCVQGASPWAAQIAAARRIAEAQYGHPGAFVATLVGVGFFDNPHGQTGGAPNAIELHPTIGICIGQDCLLGQTDAGALVR